MYPDDDFDHHDAKPGLSQRLVLLTACLLGAALSCGYCLLLP